MRRYVAFVYSLQWLVSELACLLSSEGRRPLDPDDKFDDVHLYVWYTLHRMFDPDFGDEERQLQLIGRLAPFFRTGVDEDLNKVKTWDFWFRDQVLARLDKLAPSFVLNPKEFIFHYITDGKKFSELLVFAPTYIFKEIPENMEPLTQVGVGQLIDRYQDHVETTEWGKLVAERINLLTELDIPKDHLVPKKFWRQE